MRPRTLFDHQRGCSVKCSVISMASVQFPCQILRIHDDVDQTSLQPIATSIDLVNYDSIHGFEACALGLTNLASLQNLRVVPPRPSRHHPIAFGPPPTCVGSQAQDK